MLARTVGPKFSHYPCYAQYKYNGVRALYSAGVFQSRDEKLWGANLLLAQRKQLLCVPQLAGLILDGELYCHGWRLQRINGAIAVNRTNASPDEGAIKFVVFDAVNPKAPNASFLERYQFAIGILQMANLSLIEIAPTFVCPETARAQELFDRAVAGGYEGLMLRPDGPYEPGKRSQYLYKWKQWEDGEYLCVAITEGLGKAEEGIGALVLSTPQGEFNCGTGYTDEERIQLRYDRPVGKMVRIRYPYLSEDGIPQCPSFIAVM